MQKPIELVPIPLPPDSQRVGRQARFAAEGERRNRYTLPAGLESHSPVGYRKRLPLSPAHAEELAPLLAIEPPSAFSAPDPVTEQELFEESSLGVLSSRQSTNFRGHRQVTLGPGKSAEVAALLREMEGLEGPVLDGAAYTHVVLNRPYRTPFTLLLTFVGHKPLTSLATVPARGLKKRYQYVDDIPTIGFLPHLHIGILADAMERASVLASHGKRQANAFMGPFCSTSRIRGNHAPIAGLEKLVGLTAKDRGLGWRIRLVAQVGQTPEPYPVSRDSCRRLGAILLSLRSERIQPGVNQEEKAPAAYQERQDMDVPERLAFMAGRAAYNSFVRWTGCERERAKEIMLMDRVDVLTPNGKQRLRKIRKQLSDITDYVVRDIPKWADLPLGKALSRNAERGRKAFALVGQRIYIGGLDRSAVQKEGIDWFQAVQALGAAASRSALVCELSGCLELPPDCDLLAGICLMAGPVNQNDIGKQFYGYDDLLEEAFPGRDPTSMLVWTLKAKTVADPVGNEEQLLNPKRKGALVDLRAGPHQIVQIEREGSLRPMRSREGCLSSARAYGDQGNFVTGMDGSEIPGNRGEDWPSDWSEEPLW
jgi:hypothetical protein